MIVVLVANIASVSHAATVLALRCCRFRALFGRPLIGGVLARGCAAPALLRATPTIVPCSSLQLIGSVIGSELYLYIAYTL